jgi:signal peptidase I
MDEHISPLPAAPVSHSPGLLHRFLNFLVDLIELVLLVVILLAGINTVSARIRVDGSSMFPTFLDGQYVLVDRISTRWAPLQRGDVVVFYYPKDPSQEFIKRLVGLPGDVVQINEGRVYINQTLVTETYIAAAPRYNGKWVVPPGEYFVLGDNRNNSSDSHDWGTVPRSHIIGRAVLVYWPFPEFRLVEHVNLMGDRQ